jgi:outer membrane protein
MINLVARELLQLEEFHGQWPKLGLGSYRTETALGLLARAQELHQAQEASKTAHAAYLPSVSLHATGGQTGVWPSSDFGQLGHGSIATWSVETELRWEVFNGARRHEVNTSLAQEKVAAEE